MKDEKNMYMYNVERNNIKWFNNYIMIWLWIIHTVEILYLHWLLQSLLHFKTSQLLSYYSREYILLAFCFQMSYHFKYYYSTYFTIYLLNY